MTHGFDKDYWDEHWHDARTDGAGDSPPNPYLATEVGDLEPGTALDAGCGEGAEAIWLASRGWLVTAADISPTALARAAERASEGAARASEVAERIAWVEADLTMWEPDGQVDLVTTHYAHPTIPQLEFYDRISGWVAPGGTLLIVGHLHTPGSADHGHHPPAEASVTPAGIAARLDESQWEIATADQRTHTLVGRGGQPVPLSDVVVLATRRS